MMRPARLIFDFASSNDQRNISLTQDLPVISRPNHPDR